MATTIWVAKGGCVCVCSDLLQNWYFGVSGIADYETVIGFRIFNMTDQIWQLKIYSYDMIDT